MSSETSPTYLLTAASGKIGKRLVPLLLAQPSKPTLVLPTRDPVRLRSQIPVGAQESRVKVEHGDIDDPIFVETILSRHNVTTAFICITGENELIVTLNLFDAIKNAGTVQHVVYLSACGDFGLDAIRAGTLRNNAAGHVLVKPILEAKLRYGLPRPQGEPGGFSWTIIGPSLFFDNDLRSKQSILEEGFFDEPLGSNGVSRVDPGDIAIAVANALKDNGQEWGGKKVMIGSLERYTNSETAKLWSEALGTSIAAAMSHEGGLADFEQRFRAKVGNVWARDMRLMYEFFDKEGFGMNQAEYEAQVKLLGKTPESYEKFVAEIAGQWKGSR
ncbi:hypothetical protein B0T10DRAFT_76544 [Thelonectria olida]|uniref:NAD(P)-binding domain-containing protein n=1 Tax=Thelonectria olida TaxID=1576542 RepID=A0A9P8W4C8_9HYPO|nr:hypothetical protein B0T10DRAFT_76544 [Thelonectria olida]